MQYFTTIIFLFFFYLAFYKKKKKNNYLSRQLNTIFQYVLKYLISAKRVKSTSKIYLYFIHNPFIPLHCSVFFSYKINVRTIQLFDYHEQY